MNGQWEFSSLPTSGSDIVKVGKTVETVLAQLQETRLPAGVQYHKVFYQPTRVGASLGTFVINLIESVAIVVLILMLAMGFKSGVIIGISLVVTVFGSFLFLQFTGGTMQRVSLAAFVLAMGMLVDNAIVIIDGILVDLKAGKDRMEAMTAIGRQTAMPLLGATLIAIIAFLPIYHVAGHGRCLYARSLHRAGRLPAAQLGAGTGACAFNGKPSGLHPEVEVDSAPENGCIKVRCMPLLRTILCFGLSHRWSVVLGNDCLAGSFYIRLSDSCVRVSSPTWSTTSCIWSTNYRKETTPHK